MRYSFSHRRIYFPFYVSEAVIKVMRYILQDKLYYCFHKIYPKYWACNLWFEFITCNINLSRLKYKYESAILILIVIFFIIHASVIFDMTLNIMKYMSIFRKYMIIMRVTIFLAKWTICCKNLISHNIHENRPTLMPSWLKNKYI